MWLLPHVHHWIATKRAERIDDLTFMLAFGLAGYGIVLSGIFAFVVLIKLFCF
jgi:hypothetical protein